MRELMWGMLVACVVVAGFAAAQPNQPEVDAATALFGRYVALAYEFDPRVADLYADEAVIKNTRRDATGQVREMELTGSQYKAVLRQVMPLARARGDRSSYSNVTVHSNDDGSVTIKAARYSELKNYTSPIELIVAPDAGGEWRIIEELSESRP